MNAMTGQPMQISRIATYIDKQIDSLKGSKTQRQIAQEAGYENPNILSMMKRGQSKVPIDRVPMLARALMVDPQHMMRLALEQMYSPDVVSTMTATFASDLTTENEREILGFIREVSGHGDPALNDQRRIKLREAFSA